MENGLLFVMMIAGGATMIWILATRGAATKLRASPFTETAIEGVHSVVYRPGIEPVAYSGGDGAEGEFGAYTRGLHRLSGFVFSYDGSAAEELFGITAAIDLLIRYRAGNGRKRKRTIADVLFVGDAVVTAPNQNGGVSPLIGVPFRAQIPLGETLGDHVADAEES